MMWLIITISVLCAIIYYKVARSLNYWNERGVVHKKAWYIIQNLVQLVFQKFSFYDSVRNLYQEFSNERYFGSYQFLRPALFINDPDLIKKITVKDYEYFIDHCGVILEDVGSLQGRNLFNLKGQEWRDMRATISPLFTSSKMKMMFTLINESAEEFTDYFDNQQNTFFEVEIKDVFSRFTNDVIANVAFGLKCNSLKEKCNEFYMMGKKTSFSGIRFFIFILYTGFPRIAKLLKLKFLPTSATEFFKCAIKDSVNKREKDGIIRPDMIHLLVETKRGVVVKEDSYAPDSSFAATTESEIFYSGKKPKIELTEEDITAQAIIFILGGLETTSTLMSLIAYELAMNEDVQKKLQDEIKETLHECNGKLTYEAVQKMMYMDMVVSETLRKWPTGFTLDRLCVKDYLIEPVHSWEKPLLIEKGTMIQIPVGGIHHDPKYFPDPEKFDPERFNDDSKHNIKHFTYFPFGSGPRNCIASRFALIKNKILIFHLLSKFDIVKTKKTPCNVKMALNSFSLYPATALWVGLKRKDGV
ncbi:hypothetical protein RN001_013367 [Aquatica leii]|uniref:Cytochrome P450 n=1 Tax=Aquatica leii TaxID=1421715 RepID=A0AAN7SCD1_9COLE|nr:hypothetical protein RN001_013367 [Aquatica leii]